MLDVSVSQIVAWRKEMDGLKDVGGLEVGGWSCCPIATLTD